MPIKLPATAEVCESNLLDRLTDGVVAMDRDWRITYANPMAMHISRLTPADLNSRTHWEIFPETVGSELERLYLITMETGEDALIEYYHPPFDVWLEVNVFATTDGIAVHYRDVTSRKRAEQLRDDSIRNLQQVMATITDSVVCIDRDWNCTFANEAALKVLKTDSLIGENLWTRFPGNNDEPFASNYRAAMHQRVSREFEAYYSEPLEIWFRVSAHPFEDGIIIFSSDITSRKRAEALRETATRRLTQVLNVTTDCVITLDRDWRYSFINGRAATVLGRTDLLGKNLWHEFPEAIHTLAPAYYRRCMDDGVACDFEDFYPEPLNIWFSQQCRPYDDGIAVFFRDITEERKAAHLFQQQRDLITFVQQSARIAFWTLDLASGKLEFDIGSYPVYGHELSTLNSAAAFRAIVHPDDRDQVSADVQRAIAASDLVVNDFRVIDADGDIRWLEARSQRVLAGGKPVQLGGMTIDISERKTAADELRERQFETERQRAELETVYRTAPIGLALFDPIEFRYLRLNDRQAETVGLPMDQILGRRVTEIAPIPGLNSMFSQVAGGVPIRNALIEGATAARPDEHRYWNVNYFPVFNSDGTVRAITAASLEITHQKKAELALIQSEKLAAVGRLASSISHEINNPLEAVTNLLYLIEHEPGLPETAIPFVEMAQSELARVSEIAKQALRFHRQSVSATSVTAEALVGAVLNLYRGRLVNSSVVIDATYRTQTPVLCFENDIRQVLTNLIANAIDAMRLGGTLQVRAHDATSFSIEHPEGQRGIRIAIADSGHGMSRETLDRIFEPFYTTKELNGTGLGLWISHGIIQSHGGQLRFRSSEDPAHRGTIATIFLPHPGAGING